ncbi:MAG: hypothetical protein KDJ47_13145 [Hyphomicrobiaceae bacterium]|nr:hypothetical protein [Hyphomicrobiaceae bacterium]
MRALCILYVAAGLAANPCAARAAEFTYSENSSQDIARRLDIPVFYALPKSAWLELPKTINTTDRLTEFRDPKYKDNSAHIGLRIVSTKRVGFSKRITQSGLIQTGDILLSFRPEWGGAGVYPNIQMGVSHAGMAYLAPNGIIRHIDNPMDDETLGRGDFTGEHYRTLKFMHVIRPRGLTDAQRKNLAAWAQQLASRVKQIYPKQVAFNKDYNAPKYRPGRSLDFVKSFGQAALGQTTASDKPLDMFCSEFAWSLLALRNCDPVNGSAFQGGRIPSCIKPAMTPMRATGSFITSRSRFTKAGLSDGPLLVIDAMQLPIAERDALLDTVFTEDTSRAAKMSEGHRQVAKDMQPKFEPLKTYYKAVEKGGMSRIQAYFISRGFRRALPDNYSPTSYLINTLLPPNNRSRTMDYVATIMFE